MNLLDWIFEEVFPTSIESGEIAMLLSYDVAVPNLEAREVSSVRLTPVDSGWACDIFQFLHYVSVVAGLFFRRQSSHVLLRRNFSQDLFLEQRGDVKDDGCSRCLISLVFHL